MNEGDSVIKFRCKNCGQKIHVPKIHAGKKGKCPKCKSVIVVVPEAADKEPIAAQSKPDVKEINSKTSDLDPALFDIPPKSVSDETLDDLLGLEEKTEIDEAEQTGQRKLPWFIDIFLYPISTPGLIILAIITVVPLSINIVAGLLGPLGFFVSIPGIVINIVIGLYMYWYFCECIRDSAGGGVRAPDVLVSAPSLGDMFWQVLKIVGCLAFFFLPAFIYSQCVKRTDTIFWSLLGYGVFFFPMGLLALIMFDSLTGLNPALLIGSIFSTFFPYCGLVLIFCGAVLITKKLPDVQESLILSFVLYCVFIYLMMVASHLLGRFYWRYQEKLNWEV